MCVESIICTSVDRPRSARSRNSFSQTPRSAQRVKRLQIVVGGPYPRGQSHHPQPLLRTCKRPLITRRSFARSLPRTSVGNSGWIFSHCSSSSQNRLLLIIPPIRQQNEGIKESQQIHRSIHLLSFEPSSRGMLPLFSRQTFLFVVICSYNYLSDSKNENSGDMCDHWQELSTPHGKIEPISSQMGVI